MKVEISQSQYEFRYMAWLHVIVISLLLLNKANMGPLLTGGLISFACVGFVIWLRRYKRVSGKASVTGISMSKDRQWFLRYNDSSVSGPYTLRSSTQLPYVLFIYLNPSRHGRGQTLMIPIDAVEKNDWRKLRAELRHPDSWEQ